MQSNGTQRWLRLWKCDEAVFRALVESDTLERARHRLLDALDERERQFRVDWYGIPSWDFILRREALRVLRSILSPRNERLVGDSALAHLWRAAQEGDAEVEDGFILEFYHLLRAVSGRAEVYPPLVYREDGSPPLEEDEGRGAALERSASLDRMAHRMDGLMARYPSGLEPEVVARREGNRARILDRLDGDPGDWDDWRWHYREVLKEPDDVEVLLELVSLEEDDARAVRLAAEGGVPFGVTPYYLHLMDHRPTDHDYAVRRQVFPPLSYVEAMLAHRDDRRTAMDFMRERDTSPEDLVTRRYPRIAILKPYGSCPQVCVYCQRNWSLTSPLDPSAMASTEELERAIDWFAQHESVRHVLVTGGDPLVLGEARLEWLLDRLGEVDHMRNVRVGTRTPVTVPQRITPELCRVLEAHHEPGRRTVSVSTHVEHPYEVTPETAEAVTRLRRAGLSVYNQQVFTFANSRRFETAALRRVLKRIGVDPYYTFNMKGKAEIADYAVPIARILQERKEEARLQPGQVRTDEPVFNVPRLGKNNLTYSGDHQLIGVLADGRRVYSFHPWEKNLQRIDPYVQADVGIKDYLDRLEDRGEDAREYRSIWYYY